MRRSLLTAIAFMALRAAAQTPSVPSWTELTAKRDHLPSLHQEFDVSRTIKTKTTNQSSKWQIVLDLSHGQWREKNVSGSGVRLKIFDGKDLLSMEDGGDEFVRTKHRAKTPDPVPDPYLPKDADWSKVKQIDQHVCGLAGVNHPCVVIEVPLKGWVRNSTGSNLLTMLGGVARILIDTETGLVVSLLTVETFKTARSVYETDVSYAMKRVSFEAPQDAGLFGLPEGLREVKELSRWNASKIKKQLAGKLAPPLVVTDMSGKTVSLSEFKGKTVLLDFWTTWCPPCRADAPALDKLYRKYGDKSLMIVGVSVSEDRPVVEEFLKKFPHDFPVVLTTENDFPTTYQISTFPTYIIIEPDGTIASAVEGDQGFGELRHLLKKAGLEID